MMMTQTVCDVLRSESCGDLSYAPLNHYAAGTGPQIVRQATPYKASLLRRGLFRLSGRLGNGERRIKRAGAGEKENESAGSCHRPPRAPNFLISPFSLSFLPILAVSPLKESLRRREVQSHVHNSLRF